MTRTSFSVGPAPKALTALQSPDAWRVSSPMDLVFVGGQVADLDGEHVRSPGDITSQARQVFENISRVLRDAGAEWPDVVRLDAFYCFDGPDDQLDAFWSEIAAVAAEYLPTPGPAWSVVRMRSMAYPDLLLEIDAIAAIDRSDGASA